MTSSVVISEAALFLDRLMVCAHVDARRRVCAACFMRSEFVLVQSAEFSSFFAVSCPIAAERVISITAGSGAFEEGAKSVDLPRIGADRRNPQADHIASEQLLARCAGRDVLANRFRWPVSEENV